MLPQVNDKSPEADLLTQILEVLQNSTIAEERGQDPLSTFWAAYKKVSSEYDGDMLERCNGNMDIVLIFAGLFSAVNTAFIVAMQPNPVDTTNALLAQLIQISSNSSSTIQPVTPTGFSSVNFWTQALAYASLAVSLLAAFGAVLGKQWLGYYKTNCFGRGSLEARCKQRHCKFQTLQDWQFQNVLQSFPLLLQMSLLLFGSSLGAWMWTQQRTISILIIATTVFGFLFHLFTVVVSVIFPDCPFQSPISLTIQAILRHFRASASFQSLPVDGDSTASAMQWILETSTNPDVVMSAVQLMPAMSDSEQPDVNIVSLCGDVRDMFKACFDHGGLAMFQDRALAYGKALIYFSCNNPDARHVLRNTTQEWNLWGSWRTMCLVRALEQCLVSYDRMKETDNKDSWGHHQADTRTALRMAVATGIDEFTHPDDERLVWNGQFRLHFFESKEVKSRISQLIGYMDHFYDVGDLDVAGDALLLASGIATASIPHPDICETICRRITPLLNTTHRRWRCVALGAAMRFLDNNACLGYDELFSQVVLMAVFPTAHSIRNAGDRDEFLFTNAINLLNFTKWPEGNDLEPSPLPEIQRLVLHALCVLPILKVDNVAKYTPYFRVIIRLIGADHCSALRHSALHIASSVRHDLALIAVTGCDESQRDMVLSELSPALFAAANDSSIPVANLADYLCLIFALAKSPDWCHRLIADGHVNRCTTLITDHDACGWAYLYLAGFFLRIAPPGQEASCDRIAKEQWWSLMKRTWDSMAFFVIKLTNDDTMEIIRTLVRGTEIYIPEDISEDDLRSLSECLGNVLDRLGWQNSEQTVISAVAGLKDMIDSKWELPE